MYLNITPHIVVNVISRLIETIVVFEYANRIASGCSKFGLIETIVVFE